MTDTSKTKWTKGPWRVDRSGAGLEIQPAASIHAITILLHDHEADARLISKSPEMYDELFRALAVIRNPQAFDTEGVAHDIERLLKELES